MDRVIVTTAVIGSRPSRDQNPHIPLTPEEIADSAYECFNEGASIVHVHVRDPKTQKRSMDPELFRRVFERVRSKCNMIINLTTSGGGQLVVGPDNQPDMGRSLMVSPEMRAGHVLKLKPEFCSLDIGSANNGPVVFVNVEG